MKKIKLIEPLPKPLSAERRRALMLFMLNPYTLVIAILLMVLATAAKAEDLNESGLQSSDKIQSGSSYKTQADAPEHQNSAWEIWHRQVDLEIRDRMSFFVRLAFRKSEPLTVTVAFDVTDDGHIQNLRLTHKSTNPLFDTLICQAVKSLDGDKDVLSFPKGANKQPVYQQLTFTHHVSANDGFANNAYSPEAAVETAQHYDKLRKEIQSDKLHSH